MEKQDLAGQKLEMPDAEVWYYPALFSPLENEIYLKKLTEEINWEEVTTRIVGREIKLPRLVAWYGDQGKTYSYFGLTHTPLPWTNLLRDLLERVESLSDVQFNSVLLNLYRDGRDSIGLHSDDEPELGPQPVIGSVSFGSPRRFEFRHKERPELRKMLELAGGSFLLMHGPTQQCWKHGIPKTKAPVGPRINLTFRVITRG